ncbi:MAG: exodeoxyribonuclease VII large subunit [Pirellulales bacterium]|nr:exodeoxyribonuclease VII large subunit [Pirellulales bacterium]
MPASLTQTGEQVHSVSQITAQLKAVVEQEFPSVWVAGEISNFSRPQSGHCYFTLKDDAAQLRAVIWRASAARIQLDLHDGLEVICQGRLDVYPPRGSYQLVVDQLQPQGIGALEQAFRKLREKLSKEGIFAAARKQALPPFPRRIGVVTSPTGAAIRDFLEVMRRRWQGASVLVFPARVQGDRASTEIVEAVQQANRLAPSLDVLVLCRGGGSLEDLWAFNEEKVVRAIAASRLPTVSAVGHEIDVTLADLVADVRALTPSEAAERVIPSAHDVTELVGGLRIRLHTALSTRTTALASRLDAIASRPVLSRPLDAIHQRSRQLDEHAARLRGGVQLALRDQHSSLSTLGGKLETLSPLAVLGRGYSLTQDFSSGRLITAAQRLRRGQKIVTRFAQGTTVSTIDEVKKDRNP